MGVESHLLRIGALSFRLHTQVKFPWLGKTRKALGSLLERKWVGRKPAPWPNCVTLQVRMSYFRPAIFFRVVVGPPRAAAAAFSFKEWKFLSIPPQKEAPYVVQAGPHASAPQTLQSEPLGPEKE